MPSIPTAAPGAVMPAGLSWLLAMSCGLVVANIYYAQPLAGPISASLGLPLHAAGLIVTLTQTGYGIGLLLIVPLGDIVENRRLVVGLIGGAALALAGAAVATGAAAFLAAAFLIGVGSVAVQVLVPYAAHLAAAEARGRVVGNIMGGLILGIMLARPAASFLADAFSWRAVFVASAAAMVALALLLRAVMPPRRPYPPLGYAALLASMVTLLRTTPVLRRRALYQACLFGAFSVFWTTVPLLLADTFHLSQRGIALFALAGVSGAIAAPIAGRLADRGWSRPGTLLAILAAAGAFLLARAGQSGTALPLGLLVAAAILLDFGVTTSLVLGQRAIYALGAAYRSRLNGLYMASFFAGGAVSSAVGGWAYAQGGWSWACWSGIALPLVALAGFGRNERS